VTDAERELRRRVGRVDLVVSGPPCQGHSDLNNHTRREDPKNQLVLRARQETTVSDSALGVTG
jgi:DNA (cytosine-5)-methyltransferase 1